MLMRGDNRAVSVSGGVIKSTIEFAIRTPYYASTGCFCGRLSFGDKIFIVRDFARGCFRCVELVACECAFMSHIIHMYGFV